MRRIFIPISSLVISFALALSGLVFNPANAVDSVVPVTCGSGTFTVTTLGSDVTVSDGLTCTGAVAIPEGVTAISQYAFSSAQITSVSLPASLNAIGIQPFYGTRFLTQFTVASSNAVLTSLDGVLFGTVVSGATLIAYPANKVGSNYTTPTSVSIAGAGKTVTSIETYAFQGAQNLTTLNISEGVTTLKYGIAESATLLSTINLPDSYTVMSESAFADANALTSIEIGDLVTSIAPGVFNGIRNLSSITVDNNNLYYSSIDGVLFDKSQSKLITYPQGKAGFNYAVRDGVTHIESGAFRNSKFTSVSIPEGVTHIESGAFLYSRVESISLPDSLITIASQAFQHSELMTVTIPINVSTLGKYAFNQASKLTSITVDGENQNYSSRDGVLFDKLQSKLIAYPIGNPAASYTIPSGVQTIGEDSFMFAPKLTSVVIPTDVSTIESDVFTCAYYLTSFIFLGDAPAAAAATVSSSDCAVSEPKAYIKSGNATFTLLDGKWKGLGVSEFDHFVNFDSKGGSAVGLSPFAIDGNVSAPTAPTRTGYGFIGWSTTNSVSEGGTAVTFPYTPGVTSDVTLFANWFRDGNYECSTGAWTDQTTDTYSIYGGVVSNGSACTGDVAIPEAVTKLGSSAFSNSLITSITLPESLREIDTHAFLSANLLTTVNIPKNVTTLGIQVFQSAAALTSITVAQDNPNFASSSDGVLFNKSLTTLIAYPIGKTATSYTTPSGVTTIGERAFYETKLATVVFSPDITSIEMIAFFCSGPLTSYVFMGDAPTVGSGAISGCGGDSLRKVFIKSGNNSFTLDADDKWNGLSVLEFDHLATYDSNGGSAVGTGGFTTGGTLSAPTMPTREGYGFAGWSRTDGGASVTFPHAPGVTSDITMFANWLEDGNFFCSGDLAGERATDETTNIFTITDGVVSNGGACTGDVVIPAGANSIGANAFELSAMNSVSLPATLTSIGDYAFALSTALVELAIPEGVVSIGEWAFSSSELLETITLPASVNNIGNTAFQDSLSLENINVNAANADFASVNGVLFNKSFTTLEAYPAGKPAASYTVPATVEIIDDRSFISAKALKSVLFTADSQLTSLVGSVFQTSGLTSIILPAGVETIGSAFSYAQNLTSVTIPASVTDIGGYAFQWATKLSSFYFLGEPPTVDPLTFTNIGPAPKAFVAAGSRVAFGGLGSNWNGLTVAINYTLTYAYNSATGGNTVASSSFATGDNPITLPTPTRTGYTFAGWYSNIGLTSKIGNAGANYSPTGTTAALSAYAKWTKNVKAKATVNPTVSGTAKVGKTLTAKNGTWTGSPTPSVTRQWYACKTAVTSAKSTVPSNCTKISGAIGTSLKLASAQKGKYITVLVTGISAGTTKTTLLSKSTGKVK